MCPPPNLTRTSPAAHPRSEMTYSFAVGVLPCAFACALLCVHASVDVYTQAKCVCTLEYAQGIHISLCRSSVAYTQLFLHVYLHMHKEYTPVVRCVYSICGRTFVFIYASNQVKIMLFFGCVYSFHPQNSLVLSFYPQNFSSFATNPPNIHIHGMSIHYGIEIRIALKVIGVGHGSPVKGAGCPDRSGHTEGRGTRLFWLTGCQSGVRRGTKSPLARLTTS